MSVYSRNFVDTVVQKKQILKLFHLYALCSSVIIWVTKDI